jgi:hypothetical protein
MLARQQELLDRARQLATSVREAVERRLSA